MVAGIEAGTPHDLLSLVSHTYIGDSNAHRWLDSPISIINQENTPSLFPEDPSFCQVDK